MTKHIKCYMCKSEDTGYTTDTPIVDRIKSISVGGGKDAKGELHFCNTCWDSMEANTEIRPREGL